MAKTIYNIEESRKVLKNVLSYLTPIPDQELNELASLFFLEVYPKKTCIISPYSTGIKFYFIQKGLIRIYYMADDREIMTDFMETNQFFLNGYTLFTGLPNIEYYTSVEETICLVADMAAIELLCIKYHSIAHLARKLVEKYYTDFMEVNNNRIFLSAEQRYEIFIKKRSSIANNIPLKYIASYLGITPETLSRLRSKYQR